MFAKAIFIVAVGDPWDGIVLYGPFDNFDDAHDWADTTINESWNVVEVKTPH
jgi:hypothetical protein